MKQKVVKYFNIVRKWKLRLLGISLSVLVLPWQFTNASNFGRLRNPIGNSTGINDLPTFIAKILDFIVKLGAPVVALFIIWSGFQFVLARGNDKKLTAARNTLMYTLIGAAIVLGAVVIAKVIHQTVINLTV